LRDVGVLDLRHGPGREPLQDVPKGHPVVLLRRRPEVRHPALLVLRPQPSERDPPALRVDEIAPAQPSAHLGRERLGVRFPTERGRPLPVVRRPVAHAPSDPPRRQDATLDHPARRISASQSRTSAAA
jgi:hypothetical protein